MIVSGPVIVEDNKVLLNRHGEPGFWKFCGGKAEQEDLSLIDIARREVKEEMGIDIEISDPEPFISYTSKIGTDGESIDVILIHYLAKRIGEIKPGAEIKEWAWHDLNNLPENLAPNIKPALKHFGFI